MGFKIVIIIMLFISNPISFVSSAVEHPAVNRAVVGSNPTRSAKQIEKSQRLFFFFAFFSPCNVAGEVVCVCRFLD